MRRILMAAASLALFSFNALAQAPKTKQLPNIWPVVSKMNTPLSKGLQVDPQSLNSLRFRLEAQKDKRDVGALLKSLGPGSTGGGNSCFQRIVGNYVRLVTGFRMGLLFSSDIETNDTLVSNLGDIEIQMGKDLKFNGKPVDALNVPKEKLVIIDQKICKHQRDYEFDQRMLGLLLHEAYGVAGIKDQRFQKSATLLAQISDFSEGLGHGEDQRPWLVLAEFSKLLKDKNSPVFKLLSLEDPDSSREKVNFKGLKIIKTSEILEGRAMDYGRPECEPYEKKGHSCDSDWQRRTTRYLVIINMDSGGTGWRESSSYYLEFKVEDSEVTVVLDGDPENGQRIRIPQPPAKASFLNILNSDKE